MIEPGRTLSRSEARLLLEAMLGGSADAVPDPLSKPEIATVLTTLARRGETAEELAGFADGMRAMAHPLPLTEEERARLVDTCGTGGDGSGTFNISTGAALVAAAAGALVAKHGNRAVTSKCGSADVLEALGVPIGLSPDRSVACLRATGFMFLYAPALHPAMARVAPVRRALGFRTIFNLAGPLTNPAGARAQVLGVWDAGRLAAVAEALCLLGTRHAFVVHGEGLDELTVTGTSHAIEIRGRTQPPRPFQLDPEDLGLARAPLSALGGGGSAAESAAVLRSIFCGRERGPRRDIVLLNAAAALVAADLSPDLRDALARAAEAVDSGAVEQALSCLAAFAEAER